MANNTIAKAVTINTVTNATEPLLITVFPDPITNNLQYIPLPAGYPRLPLNGFELQPVSYTQGIVGVAFVTLLIPVAARQRLNPPQQIALEGNTYTYTVSITSDSMDNTERLALLSFSFVSTLMQYRVEVDIQVDDTGAGTGGGGLGKVVMDSNMLPTDPENSMS